MGLGRAKIDIPLERIVTVLDLRLPVTKISSLLGVCSKTVHRKLAEHGITSRGRYSQISEEELDTLSVELRKRCQMLDIVW